MTMIFSWSLHRYYISFLTPMNTNIICKIMCGGRVSGDRSHGCRFPIISWTHAAHSEASTINVCQTFYLELLQHLGVSSKRADRDRRANGGKRRSDGKASPLVLIMGLCGATELPEASRG